jgi:hypothetical protein
MEMPMRRLLLAACLLFAPAVVAQPVAQPPAAERLVPGGRAGWVADGKGGCWIWAGGIETGATDIIGRWSGGCPGGPAEGTGRSTVEWQVHAARREMVYEGPLHLGKAEGQGRLDVTENGELVSRETGTYHEDRLVQGRLELPRANLVFEGSWRFGQPHGQGELRVGSEVMSGIWENGCLQRNGSWVAFTRPAEQCEGQST